MLEGQHCNAELCNYPLTMNILLEAHLSESTKMGAQNKETRLGGQCQHPKLRLDIIYAWRQRELHLRAWILKRGHLSYC